jgi:hypothetical protein
MKCWALGFYWRYSQPDIEDAEQFESVAQARAAFERRTSGCDRRYPCTSEDASMLLYFYDPTAEDVRDPYPDRRLYLGPRGGVRMEQT